MSICIGDIVRRGLYEILCRSIPDARVEISDVSVRVYGKDGGMVLRLWANRFKPYVIVTVFNHTERSSKMFDIPFADPKLFHKIVKLSKDALALNRT